MHTDEQQHITTGPDGGALWRITSGGSVSYEVRYSDERPQIFSPPDELPQWAKATLSGRMATAIGEAALKTSTAEKHSDEQRMHALFGGAPRNRAERRRWARIQKQETQRR